MHDDETADGTAVLELRAWEIRGTERVLVAERVSDQNGRRVVWHIPEAKVRGILWVEILVEDDAASSLD